jgi:hypothetical protein
LPLLFAAASASASALALQLQLQLLAFLVVIPQGSAFVFRCTFTAPYIAVSFTKSGRMRNSQDGFGRFSSVAPAALNLRNPC